MKIQTCVKILIHHILPPFKPYNLCIKQFFIGRIIWKLFQAWSYCKSLVLVTDKSSVTANRVQSWNQISSRSPIYFGEDKSVCLHIRAVTRGLDVRLCMKNSDISSGHFATLTIRKKVARVIASRPIERERERRGERGESNGEKSVSEEEVGWRTGRLYQLTSGAERVFHRLTVIYIWNCFAGIASIFNDTFPWTFINEFPLHSE